MGQLQMADFNEETPGGFTVRPPARILETNRVPHAIEASLGFGISSPMDYSHVMKIRYRVMSVSRTALASLLAILLLLFSINAFACLVPIYGGAHAMEGSNCAQPGEESAKQFCDHFKNLLVQSTQEADPGVAHDLVPAWDMMIPTMDLTTSTKPLALPAISIHAPPQDILILISVFRI